MASFDFHSFSIGLNIWLDKATEFRRKFNDHREMGLVAEAILATLSAGLHLPVDDLSHPFNKYTDETRSMQSLLNALSSDVRNTLMGSSARAYVVSFFAAGGMNREEMDSLWVAYDNFAFDSLCPASPNEEDEEEDDHDPNDTDSVESDGEDDESDGDGEEAEGEPAGWQQYNASEWSTDPNQPVAAY
jgi:hypothetical protein